MKTDTHAKKICIIQILGFKDENDTSWYKTKKPVQTFVQFND